METATTRARTAYRNAGTAALAVMLAALFGGLSAMPARADDDHGRDVQRDHRRPHPAHRPYVYAAPAYVYAPPPVYYAPPPRAPAIDLVFPLIFR